MVFGFQVKLGEPSKTRYWSLKNVFKHQICVPGGKLLKIPIELYTRAFAALAYQSACSPFGFGFFPKEAATKEGCHVIQTWDKKARTGRSLKSLEKLNQKQKFSNYKTHILWRKLESLAIYYDWNIFFPSTSSSKVVKKNCIQMYGRNIAMATYTQTNFDQKTFSY